MTDERLKELSLELYGYCTTVGLKHVLAQIQKGIVVTALTLANHSTADAARAIGVERSAFVEKRRRFGLPIERKPRVRSRSQ